MTGDLLDGYRLVRFLGRGGFGEVWLCFSEAMGDYRALKWIPASNPDHLEKEYDALLHYRKAAAALRSPSLTAIEHVGRLDSGLYYVMPLADGTPNVESTNPDWAPLNLSTVILAQIENPQWFSSSRVIELISPILDGLQTLADAGLVHRDVKPENILFFDGQPCLGDISLLGADSVELTVRGTPGYITPSWYEGGHPDMFGVAATLYSLLTGNSPDKMGRSSFSWPPQGQDSLEEKEQAEWKRLHGVIRRATEEEISERYVDFRTMAAALSRKETIPPPKSRNNLRKTLATSIAILFALVGGVVIFKLNHGKASKFRGAEHSSDNPAAAKDSAPEETPSSGASGKREAFPSNQKKAADLYKQALEFEEIGETKKQREVLELFVATGTQKIEPYFMLSLLLRDIEGEEKAKRSYKRLIQKHPDNPALKTYFCYLIQEPNEYTQHLLTIIDNHPNFTPAYYEYLRGGVGMKALFPKTTNGLLDVPIEFSQKVAGTPIFYDYQYYLSTKKEKTDWQNRQEELNEKLIKELQVQGLDPEKIDSSNYRNSIPNFQDRLTVSKKIAETRQEIQDKEASLHFYTETQKRAIDELSNSYEAKLEESLNAVKFRETYAAFLGLYDKAPMRDFLYKRNHERFISDPRPYYPQTVGRGLEWFEKDKERLRSNNTKAATTTAKELGQLKEELKNLENKSEK